MVLGKSRQPGELFGAELFERRIPQNRQHGLAQLTVEVGEDFAPQLERHAAVERTIELAEIDGGCKLHHLRRTHDRQAVGVEDHRLPALLDVFADIDLVDLRQVPCAAVDEVVHNLLQRRLGAEPRLHAAQVCPSHHLVSKFEHFVFQLRHFDHRRNEALVHTEGGRKLFAA